VAWLALVNTAFGYILYFHALKTLQALEMNAMLNLTPLGTVALAWLFLGERLSLAQSAGMLIVILGIFLVQRRRLTRAPLDL
jgi:drug/metabolite transporter (DMT)-like permease